MKNDYDMNQNKDTVGYRVQTLREREGLSQKQLAEKLYVAPSQISRLERGETTNAGTDLLIALARYFHVSVDYLLGLTPVSTPKSYDIASLGLSEESVRRLLSGQIDTGVLNRILEHDKFPYLTRLIRNYFEGTVKNGIMARNVLIDLATEPIANLADSPDADRAEIIKDLSFLRSEKIAPSEADIEKITRGFMAILRDIQKQTETAELSGPTITAEMFRQIRDALSDKPMEKLTEDDMAAAMTAALSQVLSIDEESAALSQDLMKRILIQSSKKHES